MQSNSDRTKTLFINAENSHSLLQYVEAPLQDTAIYIAVSGSLSKRVGECRHTQTI